MISVRKEWEVCETDTDKLAWAKKWGDLLMETYQNPMWTAGHTQGTKELLAVLKNISRGDVPDVPLPEEIEGYAIALETLKKTIKVVSFSIKVEESIMPNLEESRLLQVAAEQIATGILPFIDMEVEEQEDEGLVNFNFNLVLVV